MTGEQDESARDIEWIDATIPRSRRFDDTYYSRAGGQAEAGHVFVAGNDLPARWPQMAQCTIAELGFGTGLNFLETVRRWRRHAQPGSSLRFVSFELHPLAKDDMARALSRWPQLAEEANELVAIWQPDFEMLSAPFGEGAELIVFLCDAVPRLPRLDLAADAWFLDGFAPDRNPDLWSAQMMRHVFERTAPGGSFATYSAAGHVRRNLEAAGFTVGKRPGFAGKREMLAGRRAK